MWECFVHFQMFNIIDISGIKFLVLPVIVTIDKIPESPFIPEAPGGQYHSWLRPLGCRMRMAHTGLRPLGA